MLGKGLESLIPPKENTPPDEGGNGSGAQPPAPPARVEPPAAPALAQPSTTPPTSALLKKEKPRDVKPHEAIFHIEVTKITPNPHQPRRQFGEEGLNELAASIREFGILQPLVVTKREKEIPTGTDVEYQLIAGERRWLAAKKLGLETVPAIVKNINLERERLEMAVIENVQREDLNPIETARAFARLQDEFRMTQREIAIRLGKSREVVANTLRLLDLPTYIQEAVAAGQITESHGRLLLTVVGAHAQQMLFEDLVENRMTTRELKNRLRRPKPGSGGGGSKEGEGDDLSPELAMLQAELSSRLGAPVKIRRQGDTGQITIEFYSEEELKNIIERLGAPEGGR